MKINVQIDLDWIEGDGSLDDEFKYQLIEGVKKSISHDCMNNVKEQSNAAIEEAINEGINQIQGIIENKAKQFAEDWLNKEASVTDKWGDVVETCSIQDLIKNSFDRLMEKKVDSDGRFDRDSYHNKMRLIEYLTGKQVEDIVTQKLKGINKEIDGKITEYVNAGIRKNVSDKFAEMVVQTAKVDNQKLIAN